MAKVTDIQDKNGATREIQDKDLANRTSQSSIASSDYVLLEDTNGAYHKIAKASFTEAVRGALGSVINSVAKGTDIAKVPVLDSNNDLGMGTLSNLASVLGGVDIVSASTIGNDLNNFKGDKRLRIFYTYRMSDIANSPVSSGMAIIFSYCYENWDGIQLLLGASEVYYRSIVGGNWQSWHKITTS